MTCCEEYAALLDLFVDGELAAEEMTRVRSHLENCRFGPPFPGRKIPRCRRDSLRASWSVSGQTRLRES